MSIGENLCLACGLCCDGSLFERVELEETEEADFFKSLGLPLRRSWAKKLISFFNQPCQALGRNCVCRVYEGRPRQCRDFECAVFKETVPGKVGLQDSLRVVKKSRRMASAARRLLRKLGDEDEALSLDARLRRTHRCLEREGADSDRVEAFADLGLAMHKLGMFAHERFYTED
ncbi:MAG: YkgJ family cysteine cluster protein [Verrucomicrobiota bacterium]